MNESPIKDFLDYMDFLRSLGYYVSISGFGNHFSPYTTDLLNYEVHLHSICFYLKQQKGTMGKCYLNKQKLNASSITEPVYSCCYAGVEEYVVPVFYDGKCIMRINVSGFRGTLKKSRLFMERTSRLCDSDFTRHYLELSTNPPTIDKLLSFIAPMKYIIIELYKRCKDASKSTDNLSPYKQIYAKACKYIDENYMYPLSCDSISKALNYSVSYLQFVFKKEGGTTLKAHINNVRLNQARHLLLHSDIRVTDVAFTCGFTDSNYFSSAYKNKFGVSPKKARSLYHIK